MEILLLPAKYKDSRILRFRQVWYQVGVKTTASGEVEDLKFKISEGLEANWAEAGNHQFWSEPSEILNLRSLNTPKTLGFTPH